MVLTTINGSKRKCFQCFLLKLNRKKFWPKFSIFWRSLNLNCPEDDFKDDVFSFRQTFFLFKKIISTKKFEFLLQCIHYLFSCRPIIICLRQKFVFLESGRKIDQIWIRKFSNVNLSSSSLSNNWSSIWQIQITLKNTYTKVIILKS